MHRITRTLATAALMLAVAPAVASADVFADGTITPKEARSYTRTFVKDSTLRAALFTVPATLTDGTPTRTADPAVKATTFSIANCYRVSAREAVCTVGVAAFDRQGAKNAYRSVLFGFRVVAYGKGSGGSTIAAPTYSG